MISYQPFSQDSNTISLRRNGKDIYTGRIPSPVSIAHTEFLPELQISGYTPNIRAKTDKKKKKEMFADRKQRSASLVKQLFSPEEVYYGNRQIHLQKLAYKQQKECLSKALRKYIPKISIQEIEKRLQPNIGDNPLALWEKDKARCKLKLINPTSVIRVRSLSYSESHAKVFREQLEEQLKMKLISKSSSKHSSPAFVVIKHAEQARGKPRIVINYKKLNELTETDGYYIPHVTRVVSKLSNAKIFSKFDCKSGFWQIMMEKDSIPLTAFSTPYGQHEWNVMPFGIKQAPNIFQRRMDEIFGKYMDFMVVYIDDILAFSNNLEEHKEHLFLVAEKIIKHGIILGAKKVFLAKNEIDFLGLHINNGDIVMQPHIGDKIIKHFPDYIKDKDQLRRFLGCVNYCRQFIKGCSELISPLYNRLKGNWKFMKEDADIIKQVKDKMKNLPR